MIGRPRVTLTAAPKPLYLSTGRPWSWYIASTASQCSRYLGVNRVSAGSGPRRSMPSVRRRASAGSMMSISSRPRWPPSPACGLSPQTRMRGLAMPNLSRMSACRMRVTRSRRSGVIASAMSRSGRCVVTSATRRPWVASIITTWAVWVSSARNSVWPEKAMPLSLITPLCTGAVIIPAKCPSRQPCPARVRVCRTKAALALSSMPGTTGAARGVSQT
ncbi:hypothetical protein D3C78_1305200 [compost metagenome]